MKKKKDIVAGVELPDISETVGAVFLFIFILLMILGLLFGIAYIDGGEFK